MLFCCVHIYSRKSINKCHEYATWHAVFKQKFSLNNLQFKWYSEATHVWQIQPYRRKLYNFYLKIPSTLLFKGLELVWTFRHFLPVCIELSSFLSFTNSTRFSFLYLFFESFLSIFTFIYFCQFSKKKSCLFCWLFYLRMFALFCCGKLMFCSFFRNVSLSRILKGTKLVIYW